jgi:hypothetical protein
MHHIQVACLLSSTRKQKLSYALMDVVFKFSERYRHITCYVNSEMASLLTAWCQIYIRCYCKHRHVFMAPWLIITGYVFDDWIYWHILVQSLLITINYNSSLHSPSLSFYDWLLSLSLISLPTNSRSVCLGIKHSSGAYEQIFITVRQLQICRCGWGAFSDDRKDLSFTIAAGPRQHSHFWGRVPWDL